MPIASRSSLVISKYDMKAGCSIRVSAAPSEGAMVASLHASITRDVSRASPRIRKLTTPPNPRICLRAMA